MRFFTKRMSLRGSINNTLKRDYSQHNQIVNHFFNQDREIPKRSIKTPTSTRYLE